MKEDIALYFEMVAHYVETNFLLKDFVELTLRYDHRNGVLGL